jgi:hypothetical protein
MVRRIGVFGLVAVTSMALLGACSSDKKNAAADVTVSACKADPGGGRPSADGNIRNHSSKDSGYAFTVSFKDSSGNKVSNGAVTVGNVKAGATGTWHADGVTGAKGPLTCEVTNVARTAVP